MKLKDLLKESLGGIVTLKPVNGNRGYKTSSKQKVNETAPMGKIDKVKFMKYFDLALKTFLMRFHQNLYLI